MASKKAKQADAMERAVERTVATWAMVAAMLPRSSRWDGIPVDDIVKEAGLAAWAIDTDRSGWGVELRCEVKPCFGLDVDVVAALEAGSTRYGTERLKATVKVAWPTHGSQSVSTALARASLYLEMTQLAARIELVLNELAEYLNNCERGAFETADVWANFKDRAEQERKAVEAAVRATRPS